MKKFLLAIIISLGMIVLPHVIWAYSSPGKPTGYVNDFANILSSDTKEKLETKLSSLDASTSAQLSVVTIKSLNGDTIENYAEKLFKEWGIGQKGKDNGVLFLVAVDDHKLRIEVGYGLEGALTDAESSNIIRNVITPEFKKGDYNAGITNGVEAILKAAAEDLTPVSTQSSSDASGIEDIMVLILGAVVWVIPFFLWFISILSRTKSWWLGGVVGGILGVLVMGLGGFILFGIVGLIIDYIVSKQYKVSTSTGSYPWWIGGKNGFSGGSSSHNSFGGFGGGRSGGGGSSGSW